MLRVNEEKYLISVSNSTYRKVAPLMPDLSYPLLFSSCQISIFALFQIIKILFLHHDMQQHDLKHI